MEQTKIFQEIKALLSRYHHPNDEVLRQIYPHVRAKSYDIKDMFIQVDEISYRLCMITSGCAVAYKVIKGKRKLVALWKEGGLIIHAQSTLASKKSEVDIIFLSNSNTLEINISDLNSLRQTNPEINRYLDFILAEDMKRLSDHICWLKSTKAKERIVYFRENYKVLDNILPEEQKAYYLNMSIRWYQKQK